MIDLRMGDCLELMKEIPDKSIDLILCDLPYGTTACKWDNVIPFEPLWEQYDRIIKNDGVAVLFATQPFTSSLIMSRVDKWRYNWIWEKDTPNGFLNANYAPLKYTEDICVFSDCSVGSLSKKPIRYNPQGVCLVNRTKVNNPNSRYRASQGYTVGNNALNNGCEYVQKYENYPKNIIRFKRDKTNLHPTQKPVALLEYLINTYTNEGDLVLDNCMGSGSTGVACVRTDRNFIGIELDCEYYKIAERRIGEAMDKKKNELF